MDKLKKLHDAIEVYHDQNGDEDGFNTLISAIYYILIEASRQSNPFSTMKELADVIVEVLASEAIVEMDRINNFIYRCLFNHAIFMSFRTHINDFCASDIVNNLIDIRQVTSYAEYHTNRYKIRESEYKTLHHNYYVIENKINDRLRLQYGDKMCTIISNRLMVLMYSLKLISKFHCNLSYDTIQSVVKDFGNKELY